MKVKIVGVNKFKSKKGNDLCMIHYTSEVHRTGFTGCEAASCFVDNRLSFGIEKLIGKACNIYSTPGSNFVTDLFECEDE